MKKDGFIYTVIFTFIGTFVFVLALSFANESTRERVKANQESAFYYALLNAAGIETGDDPKESYNQSFPGVKAEETQLFRTTKNGEYIWIRRFSGSGLWGTVTGVLALNQEADRIVGMEIISHNETPGLGGRIEEDWFKDQFAGEFIGSGKLVVNKGSGGADSNHENQEIDGITGASLTSKSIETIINQTIELIKKEKEGYNG